MATKGAKPTPVELRVIGRSPATAARVTKRAELSHLLPDDPVTVDMAPDNLTPGQLVIWNKYLPPGLLRVQELPVFLGWVRAVDAENIAQGHCDEEGDVITIEGEVKTIQRPNGNIVTRSKPSVPKYSPWAVARDRAYLRRLKAESELGFSPTSRARAPKGGKGGGAQGGQASRFSKNAQTARNGAGGGDKAA